MAKRTLKSMEQELAELKALIATLAKAQGVSNAPATQAQGEYAWRKCAETTAKAGGIEYGFIEFLAWSGTPEQLAVKDAIKAARWGDRGRGKFHYVPKRGWKGPKAEADKLVKF